MVFQGLTGEEWAAGAHVERETLVVWPREEGQEDVIALEATAALLDSEPVDEPPPAGISIDQLRPAFVFLVKEKKKSRREVAKFFGVGRDTVNEAVNRFEGTGSFKNRPGQGRPRTSTDPDHVEAARQLIQQNPRTTSRGGIAGRSVRSVARMLGIRRESSRRILTDDLNLFAYKDVELTFLQRLQRILRGRNLKARFAHGRHRQIV
jgi:hypothetical protein